MNRSKYLILVLVFGFIAISVVAYSLAQKGFLFGEKKTNIFLKTKDETPNIKWSPAIDSTLKIVPQRVEGELYFCGERVPLEDPEVRERLDRELQIYIYRQSNTILNMKLANRYFDEIEQTLKQNDVPSDFKYLALIESDFRDVTSPAGAVGFWQFMKETAKVYDLEITEEVDERYNLDKATAAACSYLKKAKEKCGNWTLAAAAYNYGIDGMGQRLDDQKTNNYYDLFLNAETSRYLFRILAAKVFFANPQKAGYYLKEDDLYQPYKYHTVAVDTTIPDIALFAAQFGLRYKHIKLLNPWLRNKTLPNKNHKEYSIKIMETN